MAKSSTVTRVAAPHRRPRPLLPDHPARLHGGPRGARWAGHVLHDGLHRRAEPADHRHPGGRRPASSSAAATSPKAIAMVAAATALVAGVMTVLMGVVANYPLALATGLGLNAFVAFGDRQAARDDLGRRDGPGRPRGHHHPVLVLTGFRQAVFQRDAGPAQDRDLASASACSSRFIGLVDAGFVREAGTRPGAGRARHRRLPHRLAAARLRRRPAGDHRDDGPQGEGRHPLRHRRRHRRSRSSSRRSRNVGRPDRRDRQGRQPVRLGPERPDAPRARRRRPRLRAARPVQPARLVRARSASSPPCCSSSP